jgi:hypothetical protein
MLAWYTNRAGYLMSIGMPAAQVALYHPASSMWLGDEDADRSTTKLSQQLLEHQIDFDYIDEQSLSSVATLEKGGFKNLSGQVYRAVIIPSSTVISRAALDRLRAFAASGGKVVFVGKLPSMVVDKTFLHAVDDPPDLSFAPHEASGNITPAVVAALPTPDFVLDQPCPEIRYNHRAWSDADLYFIFNQSDQEQKETALLAGRGRAQVWDLSTGTIHPMFDAKAQGARIRLPLILEPYEARVIIIGATPPNMSTPEPVLSTRKVVQELNGDWLLSIQGKDLTAPLKSWQDLGIADTTALGTYKKEFTLERKPATGRLFLELSDVRDYARVNMNGVDLQARGWQPYRWDVTRAVKPGNNVLEIEVRSAPVLRGAAPIPLNPGANQAGAIRNSTPPQVSGLLGSAAIVSLE